MKKIIALIVAAGRGSRFGEGTPKQYHDLAGQMVLTRTINAFLIHPKIAGVKVVIHKDDVPLYEMAVAELEKLGVLGKDKGAAIKLLPYAFGGAERQDSVRLGLESLATADPDIVLIHDAARPFIAARTIDAVIEAVHKGQGAIAAVPVTDTIKRVGASLDIEETVDRSVLWRAQTPQGFVYDEILDAHEQTRGQKLTDDATVAQLFGIEVKVVAGTAANGKITTLEDLEMAEKQIDNKGEGAGARAGAGAGAEAKALAGAKELGFRVGNGFDAHKFCEGEYLYLCGVKIPFTRGLLGHSDADVALHALTDALYGAVGDGDIGSHFPPSDDKWKGADSALFLAEAGRAVNARGWRVGNVDITIMCEAPKVGKYREAMRARVAEILGLELEQASVKGTTTEGLGFTGRSEGIAALATVCVEKG